MEHNASERKYSTRYSNILESHVPPAITDALRILAWVEWLCTDDLQLALGMSLRSAQRRLLELHHSKLTQRANLPGANAGGPRRLHFLSRKGAKVASELLGYPIRAPRSSSWMTPLLYHKLETTRALCAFAGALGKSLVSVRTGEALAARFGGNRRKQPYVPDGALAFQAPRSAEKVVRHAFLEIDRGTEDAGVLAGKLRALHRYYASGQYRKDFMADRLVVLFIVPDQTRKLQIERAILEVRPCVRVFVGLSANCQRPDEVLAAWTDPLRSKKFHLTQTIVDEHEEGE